ncbi:MAG: alanine racemase [Acidobacteriaceae bacterium]|nr:alanine racemase [Acidobacteriaceae bacterium]
MNSWVELSRERLAANYRTLAEAAESDVALLAVVKSDSYGHSASLLAPVLVREGARWLGVKDADEGAAVVESLGGISPRPQILIMSGLVAGDVEEASHRVEHRLVSCVWTVEQLECLADAASRHDARSLPVHLEIDTGMSRQGVPPGKELDRVLTWIAAHPLIVLDGVLTHFAASEVAGSSLTAMQRARFEQACRSVAASGLRPAWLHAGSTSMLDNCVEQDCPGFHNWLTRLASELGAQPMVRTGIGLYGYSLPIEHEPGCSGPAARIHDRLQPVMTWKTRILAVRDLDAGEVIGYNGIFAARRPMRVALLPVGYADGLRRELSSSNDRAGGWVMIHGCRAPILGRISMNLTTVDVSGIDRDRVGDEVVLLGDGITADDHARLAHTIAYEILCEVRARASLV